MKNKPQPPLLISVTAHLPTTACARITRSSICVLIAFIAVLSGCANSPRALSKMTPGELQTVDAHALCFAYATSRTSNVSDEVQRKGLTCKRELALYVSDCSDLRLVSAVPNRKYINVTDFAVTNNSNEIKKFNITLPNNMLSGDFKIGPRSSGTYHVAVDPNTQRTAQIVDYFSGRSAVVPFKLNTCYASDHMN